MLPLTKGECMDKKNIIGIPRGMSYYTQYPFWYGFFNALGIEIVLSDKTTKETVSSGAALVVTETCLPVKIYVGHVLNLLQKGVKRIFVPSIQSIAPKIYNCSKIRGLPDLIRNIIKEDFELIEPTLDKSEKNQGLYEMLADTVKCFGITDFDTIRKASKEGWRLYNNFHIMARSGIPYEKAFKNALEGNILIEEPSNKQYDISVAIAGHDYNLFDKHSNMKIFEKLEKMGIKVSCSINLTDEKKMEGLNTLEQKMYWANELEMNGTAGHYLTDNNIDGIITLNAFGCGPDSLMVEKITRKAKEYGKPLLILTMDEHTGEAGFVTRLEAFVDMLFRKKRKQESASKDFAPSTNVCDYINK